MSNEPQEGCKGCPKEKPSILVVDDNRDAREVVRMLLDNSGYCTIGAATAGEVISLLDEHCSRGDSCPDLIILDIDLPDVRGGTLGKWIRQVYPRIPFIFLTAFGRLPAFIEVAEQLGAPLETKPITPERLLELVRDTLRDFVAARMVGKPVTVPPLMREHIAEVAADRERSKSA